jgi:hypothetical protein
MSWVAAAIVGGAVIGGAASTMGADKQAEGIESSARIQSESGDRAIASQEKQFERLIELQEPFRTAGVESLPQLLSMSRADITKSPQFKLQQDEGEEGIDRAAAARGGFGNTATVERLGEFNRRLLSSESDKQYGRLLDLVNIGRGAATTQGAAGQTTGTNISNIGTATGTNLANLEVLGAQNRASTYANIGNLPGQTTNALNKAGVFDSPGAGSGGVVDTGAGMQQEYYFPAGYVAEASR